VRGGVRDLGGRLLLLEEAHQVKLGGLGWRNRSQDRCGGSRFLCREERGRLCNFLVGGRDQEVLQSFALEFC